MDTRIAIGVGAENRAEGRAGQDGRVFQGGFGTVRGHDVRVGLIKNGASGIMVGRS
jgi:hypothetical protein